MLSAIVRAGNLPESETRAMLRRNKKPPGQEVAASRRGNTLWRAKQQPVLERRQAEDRDEIDERELDKISGGRIFRVDDC